MEGPKTFFEQIPVETVKKIATEFSAMSADECDNENTEIQVISPNERWREIALSVQHERDPKKMTNLVEQLIAALDEEQLHRRIRRTRDAGNSGGD